MLQQNKPSVESQFLVKTEKTWVVFLMLLHRERACKGEEVRRVAGEGTQSGSSQFCVSEILDKASLLSSPVGAVPSCSAALAFVSFFKTL